MNKFDVKARERERQFIKHIKNGYTFSTGTGKQNYVVEVTEKHIRFRTNVSKRPCTISRNQLRKAIRAMFYQRTLTRKDLEIFSRFSSAIMGVLRLIFSDIAKIRRTVRGLLRITLKGTRFFFSGVDRAPRDLELIRDNGGSMVLMSYYHLREDKHCAWKRHVQRLGLKVLLDSGAFSVWKAEQNGRDIRPLDVEEYAAFIQAHRDVFYGWFNLDKVGDPETSKQNADYLKEKGIAPIEVWHIQSDWCELEQIVRRDPPVIGIGGSAQLSKKKRRVIFDELYRRYPEINFHALACGAPILYEYDWFTADASTWLTGRSFHRIITPKGQTTAPDTMSALDCVIHNIRELVKLEENYIGQYQTTLFPEFSAS